MSVQGFPLCETEKGFSGEQSALNDPSEARVITGREEDLGEMKLEPDLHRYSG